jgi:proteic killer suppression protein
MKLNAIDAAIKLQDLRVPPSNRLEALKGDTAFESMTNDGSCFVWRAGHAKQIEIVDYH